MANDETTIDRTTPPAYAMTRTAEQAGTAIDINGLQTYLFTRAGIVKAVDDVSFALRRGETLAIVGEPTNLRVVTAHKGSLWLRLDTRGRAAHPTRPPTYPAD